MTAALMPLEDLHTLADQIIGPCVSQLSDLDAIKLKGRITRAIMNAQYATAIEMLEELK